MAGTVRAGRRRAGRRASSPSWPDGAALELGIGTGRIAIPLSQRGVGVHGIELSPAMVAQLRAKPGADRVGVTIGDFATTRVGGTVRPGLPRPQHDREPDHAGRPGRLLPQRRRAPGARRLLRDRGHRPELSGSRPVRPSAHSPSLRRISPSRSTTSPRRSSSRTTTGWTTASWRRSRRRSATSGPPSWT